MTVNYEVRLAAKTLAAHGRAVLEHVPDGRRPAFEIAIQDVETALKRQGPISPNSPFGRMFNSVCVVVAVVFATILAYGALRNAFTFLPPADGFPFLLLGVGLALGGWIAWNIDRQDRH